MLDPTPPRSRLPALTLTALVLVLAAPPVNASDWCWNSHTVPVSVAGTTVAYVAADSVWSSPIPSVWIYAESNGISDLQRGGKSLLFGDADPCQEHPTPDLAIF